MLEALFGLTAKFTLSKQQSLLEISNTEHSSAKLDQKLAGIFLRVAIFGQ